MTEKTQQVVRLSVEFDVSVTSDGKQILTPTGKVKPEGKLWTTICDDCLQKIS
jgi:hypothetical protein